MCFQETTLFDFWSKDYNLYNHLIYIFCLFIILIILVGTSTYVHFIKKNINVKAAAFVTYREKDREKELSKKGRRNSYVCFLTKLVKLCWEKSLILWRERERERARCKNWKTLIVSDKVCVCVREREREREGER